MMNDLIGPSAEPMDQITYFISNISDKLLTEENILQQFFFFFFFFLIWKRPMTQLGDIN